VVGEHDNVKYLWNFRSRFGFFPLASRRFLVITGVEFNHEAFLRDLGGQQVHLNKVWLQSFVLGASLEWARERQYAAFIEGGVKGIFSLPMDAYLIRNGLVSYGKASLYWKWERVQLSAAVGVENRWQDTTLGYASQLNTQFELGVGWGEDLLESH
jgi:hypothetical protein